MGRKLSKQPARGLRERATLEASIVVREKYEHDRADTDVLRLRFASTPQRGYAICHHEVTLGLKSTYSEVVYI